MLMRCNCTPARGAPVATQALPRGHAMTSEKIRERAGLCFFGSKVVLCMQCMTLTRQAAIRGHACCEPVTSGKKSKSVFFGLCKSRAVQCMTLARQTALRGHAVTSEEKERDCVSSSLHPRA